MNSHCHFFVIFEKNEIMDRRNFLKAGLASAAGIAAAPEIIADEMRAGVVVPIVAASDGRAGSVSTDVEKHLPVEGYVREPSHRVPVVASVDVVVAGGGAAGVAAAVCAARHGASVMLIERMNYLGGLWTGGLVLPVLATHGLGKTKAWDKATGGFCTEICDELLAKGWAVNPMNPTVDPEATKYLMDKMIFEAGVKIVYNATVAGAVMSGNRVDAVLVDCNTGRIAIRCKTAVDASGDGILFHYTGDPYEARRYHMTTLARVYGITEAKAPVPGMRTDGAGSREVIDGLDVMLVSATQQKHRMELWERTQKRRQDTGKEDIHLMEIAPTTGLRVTRVLDSIHNVTLEESMEWTAFDDVIGMSGVCDPFEYKGRHIAHKDRPIWQIPYRSLVPRETRNLLVCGRCFGYDQGITWDAREISTCMVTGQAAGVAAAMASASRCAAKEVDVKALQKKLRADGVRLDF